MSCDSCPPLYQIISPDPRIVDGTAPVSLNAGQAFIAYIKVINYGEGGTIYANFFRDGQLQDAQSIFIPMNYQYTFYLNGSMGTANYHNYQVDVGYLISGQESQEDTAVFSITLSTPSLLGIPAPPGATDAMVLETYFSPIVTSLASIINAVNSLILPVAGITVVKTEVIPGTTKIVVWLRDTNVQTRMERVQYFALPHIGAVAAALIIALTITGAIILGYSVISLLNNMVDLQKIREQADVVKDTQDLCTKVQADPTLTPEQKAAICTAALQTTSDWFKSIGALGAIPWKWILGGAVAVAAVGGLAYVLGKPDFRTTIVSGARSAYGRVRESLPKRSSYGIQRHDISEIPLE